MTTPSTSTPALAAPLVFLVDDDPAVRKGLSRLLRAAGHHVEAHASADEFLARDGALPTPACLVLDVSLPGIGGLELQKRLAAQGSTLPIVFITGHGDIPMGVNAIKSGALDFLVKPVQDEDLLRAIAAAHLTHTRLEAERFEVAGIRARIATLTPREQEVLALVVSGLMNKQIADRLGATEKTIKVHRGRVMQKMQAQSLAELVHLAERAGVPSAPRGS